MTNFIVSITAVNIFISILTPLYLNFRSKMSDKFVKKNLKHSEYNVGKIFRFLLLNFSITLLGLVILTWMLLTHIPNTNISSPLVVLFVLSLVVFVYGNGIYATAVINESYTLKPLHAVSAFKILRGAELVMHGPVSHVMMFMSMLVATGLISMLEMQNTGIPLNTFQIVILTLNGIVSGLIFALSQIYNMTWKHELPPLLLLANTYIMYLLFTKINLINYELSFTYFVGICTATIALVAYFIYQNIHNHPYFYQDLFPKN